MQLHSGRKGTGWAPHECLHPSGQRGRCGPHREGGRYLGPHGDPGARLDGGEAGWGVEAEGAGDGVPIGRLPGPGCSWAARGQLAFCPAPAAHTRREPAGDSGTIPKPGSRGRGGHVQTATGRRAGVGPAVLLQDPRGGCCLHGTPPVPPPGRRWPRSSEKRAAQHFLLRTASQPHKGGSVTGRQPSR